MTPEQRAEPTFQGSPHMSASRNRSRSILSVRTWAKCSEWFSLFLSAMNSGIFSKAPYL